MSTYEVADPTIDSQIVLLKNSRANVFVNLSSPKFAAQGIRKAHVLGWRPVQYLTSPSSSVLAVMKPAGFEAGQDIMTIAYLKDATDPQWASDPELLDWKRWMEKWNPTASTADYLNVYAYAISATLVEVLKRCGDDLTRANIMKQASNLRGLRVPMLLPGITINTSPTDFYPIQAFRLARFKGEAGNCLAMSFRTKALSGRRGCVEDKLRIETRPNVRSSGARRHLCQQRGSERCLHKLYFVRHSQGGVPNGFVIAGLTTTKADGKPAIVSITAQTAAVS
jgi:hypothetical protein